MEDYCYRKESDGVYRGTYAGSRDGQKFQGNLTVTVSENCVKFETDGLKRGGEPVPELSVTLTRVKNSL